jgi:peptidoglycan/LPS O-acetylase OafA/YrhL
MRSTANRAAAAPAAAYPARIAPLVGLQAFAIGWVVLNQFRLHLGLAAGERSGLVFKGYLGAELFFVLTGFLTAHAYGREVADGGRGYGGFLYRRLIGIYPLHLVTIAVMAVLMAAAAVAGAGFPHGVASLHGLVSNLLLVQAWGVEPSVSWNFPSWLVSAEWFGFIVFPVTAWLTWRAWPNAWIAVLAPLTLFAVLFQMTAQRGVLFTDMTAQIGAAQTIPAFLLGAGLYRLSDQRPLPRGLAGVLAVFAAAWIVAAALARLSDLVIVPAFGLLTLALAETARGPHPALSGPAAQYLGRISIAVCLVYLPVDIVYFHAVARLFGQPHGAAAWAVWFGVFPAIAAAGAVAHHLVQRPAETWLARLAAPQSSVTALQSPGL